MVEVHYYHEMWIRAVMAGAMIFSGIAAFLWPGCFIGLAPRLRFEPEQAERVARVVAARESAEGISRTDGRRYVGGAALLVAALELVPSVPIILPYALFCFVIAVVVLLAYMRFHRASAQRIAPLVRRSPFTALPALLIAALFSSVLVPLTLLASPFDRLGAIVVSLSTLLLSAIAWRIANAPALLLGLDPQCEYAIDERLRVGRARSVASLACALAYVFVALAQPSLPDLYGALGEVAFLVTVAAFVVSTAASFWPLRRLVRFA